MPNYCALLTLEVLFCKLLCFAEVLLIKRCCIFQKSLSDHKNIVTYVDSAIYQHRDGIHEYMLLTEYYRRKLEKCLSQKEHENMGLCVLDSVLSLMNERLVAGRSLSISEVLSIFCDVCEAVSRLHHSQTPVIHRDLKVSFNCLLNITMIFIGPFSCF